MPVFIIEPNSTSAKVQIFSEMTKVRVGWEVSGGMVGSGGELLRSWGSL